VVGPLAEVLSQRRVGGHLANDRDLADPFARAHRTAREDAQALDAGRLDVDIWN
jgi:hypothetical protein